jgi:hypothetical protein
MQVEGKEVIAYYKLTVNNDVATENSNSLFNRQPGRAVKPRLQTHSQLLEEH